MRSDLHDITMQLHHKTDKAVLVSDDGERDNAVWLPMKHIEIEPSAEGRAFVKVTMPEWLAIEKGLL